MRSILASTASPLGADLAVRVADLPHDLERLAPLASVGSSAAARRARAPRSKRSMKACSLAAALICSRGRGAAPRMLLPDPLGEAEAARIEHALGLRRPRA